MSSEIHLRNIQSWVKSGNKIDSGTVPMRGWTWRTVESAAQRLRRTDGTPAVAKLERDCRTRGLMGSVWTTGSYQPHDRSVYVAARNLHEESLDTIFHEFAHALLHYDVDEAQYRMAETWIEAEADVTCDLARCLLGAGPRANTLRTLAYMGNLGDLDGFFMKAGPAMCEAAEQIVEAFEDPQYSFSFMKGEPPMHGTASLS